MIPAARATGDSPASDRDYSDIIALLLEAIQRPQASIALLLVDVADVTGLQARLGFQESSAFLHKLQAALTEALKNRATIARFGDGRLCCIVDRITSRGHAVLAAEKLTRVANEVTDGMALGIKPQINIGVALYPAHASDPDALLRHAQLAAAAARKGSQRLQVFDQACAIEMLRPWELAEDFADALSGGELTMFYQPKVRIADGRCAGVEALMRWLRDGTPVATPDVFIPLAEESGLMTEATWYATSNALRFAAECGGLPMAVNIPPSVLHHKDFMQMMATARSAWGMKDGALTLEVTEGGLIADFDLASSRLAKLRDAGFRVSIDDFGTGFSSLSYFKKIPADELKIDKSFTSRMLQDPSDERLVSTIIGLASQFNLETVAEGVETREVLDALARMGCGYAQGHLISPAIGGDDLKIWLGTQPGIRDGMRNS